MSHDITDGVRFLAELGAATNGRPRKRYTLALCTDDGNGGTTVTALPVELARGAVKYPICTECGSNVAWHRRDCQCANLQETSPGVYHVRNRNVTFRHRTFVEEDKAKEEGHPMPKK